MERQGAIRPPSAAPGNPDEEEIRSLRDRLNEDDAKVADTFSSNVRTVSTGLALITDTIMTTDQPSPFFKAHFEAMRAGSVMDLCALVADALQYTCALLQILRTRHLVVRGLVPQTRDGIVAARTNAFYRLREVFFVVKAVLAAVGSAIVIVALLRTDLGTFSTGR